MAEVLLFHHALGLTPGVHEFAKTLTRSGHTVHVPDLYDGRVFKDLHEGIAYAHDVGFLEIIERGRLASVGLTSELVYAGFSLGVLPTQMLAQTRPGAKGALLFEACVPTSEFGDSWPQHVPVQIHGMDGDESFVDEGDIDAARALVASTPGAELFLYSGNKHLFADTSLTSYDKESAALLTQRVLSFLVSIDESRVE